MRPFRSSADHATGRKPVVWRPKALKGRLYCAPQSIRGVGVQRAVAQVTYGQGRPYEAVAASQIGQRRGGYPERG
jgi:hypothetical protein